MKSNVFGSCNSMQFSLHCSSASAETKTRVQNLHSKTYSDNTTSAKVTEQFPPIAPYVETSDILKSIKVKVLETFFTAPLHLHTFAMYNPWLADATSARMWSQMLRWSHGRI